MIDINDYSLMRLIYLLLLGLQVLLFKKRFPTEMEIWLISSHLFITNAHILHWNYWKQC